MGLLLYKGGTVCGNDFDQTEADSICKQMNYICSANWSSGERFEIQVSLRFFWWLTLNYDSPVCVSELSLIHI